MKKYKLFAVLAILLCVVSCGTMSSSDPFTVSKKLEMNMNDLTFLGETEISCEYDTYFGIIRHLNMVNGENYIPGNDDKLIVHRAGLHFPCKGMNLASAKIMKQYPEACYFQVIMETKKTDVLFLGSTTKRTAKIRAYKFK